MQGLAGNHRLRRAFPASNFPQRRGDAGTRKDAMMYELILIVCLMAEPDDCHAERLPFVEISLPYHCAVEGQLQAVRWLSEHPGWTLLRWRCEPPQA